MKRDPNPIEPPTVFPWAQTLELMAAGRNKDHGRINQITDSLVALGLCRPRHACDRYGTVQDEMRARGQA